MRQFNSIAIEQYNNKKGVTLVELSIAICIFSLIVIGFASIGTFSQYYVITSDRRAKLQNDASYVLEHMAKNLTGTGTLGGAIGNVVSSTNYPVQAITISPNSGIAIRVDSNNNGQLDGSDRQIAYIYDSANYWFLYYPDASVTSPCPGSACTVLTSSRIRSDFSTTTSKATYYSYSSANNYIEVQIGACWTPSSDATCGTVDNPALEIKNRISMPAVSTN
jgi:Tfp pilus assembly protein PilW